MREKPERKASAAFTIVCLIVFWGCNPPKTSSLSPTSSRVSQPAAPAQEKSAPHGLILVIGDGMGPGQVGLLLQARPEGALARMMREGQVGLVDTTPFEALVTDSAAGGTALASGVKTRPRMVGMDPDGWPVESLLEAGQRLGRATGVVTTADLTDATPAAFLSHSTNRKEQADIARQILQNPPTIAIGGGSRWFPSPPPSLELEGEGDLPFTIRGSRPSLQVLVERALAALEGDPDGYVLVVEAAHIDKACHGHLAAELLGELIDLDEALAVLLSRARSGEALVVVTADHETGGFALHYRRLEGSQEPRTLPSGERWSPGGDFGSSLDLEALLEGKTPASVTWSTFTHTAAPVPLVAQGPGAGVFGGFHPQAEVGRLLREAIGAGPPAPLSR